MLPVQGGLWHLWCACLPLLLACQEVMAEESAPKVSLEPSACHGCHVPCVGAAVAVKLLHKAEGQRGQPVWEPDHRECRHLRAAPR